MSMIVHRHGDGSEGYQYEVGDEVVIKDIIARNNWLRRVIGRTAKITRVDLYRASWRTAKLDVRDSPEWGPVECFPWMLVPTDASRCAATYVAV
jgi:hypothetical protein